MNSDDLKPQQSETIKDELDPRMRYLQRLETRMYARGWDRDDETFRLLLAANSADHRLWVQLHYRSCGRKNGGAPPGVAAETD